MIRIALVTANFPSMGQLYIFEWASALKNAGVDVTILTETFSVNDFPRGKAERDEWTRCVIPLYDISHPFKSIAANPLALFSWLAHPRKFWRMVSRLKREFKFNTCLRKIFEYLPVFHRKFDLVHFNAPQIAIRRIELGPILGAPTLVSFRGQDFSFAAARFRLLLTRADHLHFISNHLVELAKEQGYEGGRHTIIPPMVDVDDYQPPARRDHVGAWTILSAARFSWTKGWEFALQTVALLIERGWDIEYNIAGEGEMKDAILYTIHALKLQDHVYLLGWLSTEEMKKKMQESDLYLLASVEEGFNNSVLQAQACGLPVVCSDAGGLPENIVDGETGLLPRCRDAWDMADKIESLLSNPEYLANMGRSARARVVNRFSTKSGVQAFLNMYTSLAGRDV